MTRPTVATLAGALIVSTVVGLGAHHSVPVNFDQSKEVTVTGVITEIKWVNPHSHWRLEAQGDDGKPVEWLIEFGAVNTMKRAGFPMERFKFGDTVAVMDDGKVVHRGDMADLAADEALQSRLLGLSLASHQ